MKTYNKLPFKERKRQLQKDFERSARQEERLLDLERKRYEAEVSRAKQGMTDKEMQEQEAFERLLKLAKEGEQK